MYPHFVAKLWTRSIRVHYSGRRILIDERLLASVEEFSWWFKYSLSGYRVSCPRVKRPGRGFNLPTHTSGEIKERIELHLIPICAFMTCSRVSFTSLCNMTTWRLVNIYTDVSEMFTASTSEPRRSIKREATDLSENLVTIYQNTRRQILEQLELFQRHNDKIKSREVCPSWGEFTFFIQLHMQVIMDFILRLHPL